MNVLVLTPARTGSTIVQRIVTLALWLSKVKIMNIHELTNGLLERDGKIYQEPDVKDEQSVEYIINILKKQKINIVSRLAKHYLDDRDFTEESRLHLYDFLKGYNQKIIACKRKNIFEYAMSWSIMLKREQLKIDISKTGANHEKIGELDTEVLRKKCEYYIDWCNWLDDHFEQRDTVYYEDFVSDPDKIVGELLGLENIFEKTFGEPLKKIFHREYQANKGGYNVQYSKENLPTIRYGQTIELLQKKQVLPIGATLGYGVPIKQNSLNDKKEIVSNYDQCKDIFLDFARRYNWVDTSIVDNDFWVECSTHF